jgi:hypothetical protein
MEEEMTTRKQEMRRRYRDVLRAAVSSPASMIRQQGSEQQKSLNTLPSSGTGSPP